MVNIFLFDFSFANADQFLSLQQPMEQLYRGSFTVQRGDTYTPNLQNSDSTLFKEKSAKYKGLIDALYSDSILKNAYLGSEILAFDG